MNAVSGSVDAIPSSRLRAADVARVGSSGLRTRKLRTALSALGISIGIAALVGVLGLSESSRADLRAEISKLGTNLLAVQPGSGFGAGNGQLPAESAVKIERIGPVQSVSTVIAVNSTVLRNNVINSSQTEGISVAATDPNLLSALNGHVAAGRWLDAATAAYPTAVLGSVAAERLGVTTVDDGQQVLVGGEWFTVIGVLESFPLAPDLDRAAIVGIDAAVKYLGATDAPSRVFVRTDPKYIDDVRGVLPLTADPENPEEVQVSRPSDALEAQAAADDAFTSLFLGLGAVALLVGGIGIANVMVIAVIERRHEIGLRRALGATRAHIRRQFLTESLVLAGIGGVAGVAIGALVTVGYASSQGWRIVLPWPAALGGVAAALVIGAIAGLYPAARAANLSPTDALRAS
jgi:putative ABC transport system permease protein